MKKINFTDVVSRVAVFLVAIIPIFYLVKVRNINDDIIAYGAASWIIAVLLKTLIYQFLIKKYLHKKLSIKWVSAINGLNSGLFELGSSLIFFYFMAELSFLEVISFGVGVGSVEAAIIALGGNLLKGTELEPASEKLSLELSKRSNNSIINWEIVLSILERVSASVIHVATRGLLYIFYINFNLLSILIALMTFILADGIVGYQLIFTEKIAEFKILIRFYAFLILLAIIDILVFLWLW